MKKLFAVLILFSLPLAPVRAQGLHRKILIVRDSIWQEENRIEALLPTIYQGIVDSTSSLPNDLSGYDAVLLFVTQNSNLSDTLSFTEALELIDFVKNGGKLYAESSEMFAGGTFLSPYSWPFDTLQHPRDTIWHFLGLQKEGFDDIEDSYNRFFGVDSEFTRGLNVPNAYDPAQADVGSTYYPFGDFIPVLFGEEVGFDEDDIFAWIPPDTSVRAVMHHALDFGYYDPFLTRVLCDYFGLCVDAVHQTPPSEPAIAVRVIYDGLRTDLQISGEVASEVDVANALGVIVFCAPTQAGTSLVELPATLPDGFYFARVQSESGVKVEPFAIIAR